MKRKILAAFLAAWMLVGIPAPALLAAPKKEAEETKKSTAPRVYPPLLIGPGDLLTIVVYGEVQLPVEYQVDSDGIITFPYAGSIFVSGLSPSEASSRIAKLLAKPRKVTVLIKESNTYWVSILGNVGKPGKYQIRGKPTLISALAEAGGPLPNTDLGGTILIHRGNKKKIDLGKYLNDEGQTGEEPFLYPGDVLTVQKSGWPSVGEFAIAASILASLAVVAVQLGNLKK